MSKGFKTTALQIVAGLGLLCGSLSIESVAGPAFAAYESTPRYDRAFASGDVPRGKESIRKELIRLQTQTGLALVTIEDLAILEVDFGRRRLLKAGDVLGMGVFSRDGAKIAFTSWSGPTLSGISRSDGSDFQEYPDFSPEELCWSPDGTRLSILLGSSTRSGLYLWVVNSDTTLRIGERGSLTSQCWSPDGKRIVYEVNGIMKIYNVEKNVSWELWEGKSPTWSPDGEWIAFHNGDTYYAIRPDGQERKPLFRRKNARSALWWSPDSRLVAYLAVANPLAGSLALDVENFRLHVRRLSDNSDAWVVNSGGSWQYQWVTNPELLRQAQLKPTQK